MIPEPGSSTLSPPVRLRLHISRVQHSAVVVVEGVSALCLRRAADSDTNLPSVIGGHKKAA